MSSEIKCESISSNNEKLSEDPIVVVTGFGLFGNYSINSSWQCVKRLQLDSINLIIREVPVAYEEVDKYIEEIWAEYKPNLVIHCGVSSIAKCVTLETRAVSHKSLYTKPDVFGRLPKGIPSNVSDDMKFKEINDINDCHSFQTKINLQKVCDEVNQHFERKAIKIGAEVSKNAGRFLCEYIYRCSLEKSCEKTVFIHIPDISENFPLNDIFPAVELTINTIIKEVIKNNKQNNN